MRFVDNLEENEFRVTGVKVSGSKTFSHKKNLLCFKISASSYGKTFDNDNRAARREFFWVELHDQAAEKARYYERGDLLHIKGQLEVRNFTKESGQRISRVVIVVEFPRQINMLRQGAAEPSILSGEGESNE